MLGQRNVGTKTLTLGNPETFQLPRNYALKYLTLKISGTIDINSAAVPTMLPQGAAALLSNIQVRRAGRDNPINISGALLYELNKLLYGRPGQVVVAANSNAVAAATSATLIIPFENVGGVRPFDTLLKGKGLSSLDLGVTVDAASALAVGGTTVVIAKNTSFTLEVNATEEEDIQDSQGKEFNFGNINIALAHKVAVAGAANDFQVKPISVGNFYKGFMIYTDVAGVGDDAVISNIILKSGSRVFVNRPAQALADEYAQKAKIATRTTGVYYIDLLDDGRLNSALDVTPQSGNQTLEFSFTTLKAGNISIVGLEWVPPSVVVNK